MAQGAREYFRRLHHTVGEHAMAGGEAGMVANAGMAFSAIPRQNESMYVIFKTSRTHWNANQGGEHAGGLVPWRCHGR